MKTHRLASFILTILVLAGAATAQQSQRDQGIDLSREGKFAEAVVLLEKTVTENKKDRIAWLYLGGSYVHTKLKGKAEKAFGNTGNHSDERSSDLRQRVQN